MIVMPNRLAQQTSPYLQQHADNPVDWYPWGEEALKVAREQDKPILLSIGYSACHWCHVMAHESFEDPEVAALMNKLFINIKVDKEERPDLDQIYQSAHNVLTSRRGGWPLTMFLMPDQRPFFGGTYFPKTARPDKPGMMDLLPQLATAYRDRRSELEQRSESLRAALAQTQPAAASDDALTPAPLAAALAELKQLFDETRGGLSEALKFPHPAEFEFLLHRAADLPDEQALGMVKLTLARMGEGGLYDQLGGGFYRYCVDQDWTIPHFEKMLYDNGPLLRLYADLWLVDRQPLYARVVADTAGWAMREMQARGNSNKGGYYSTLDADSEHEEGKFYVWTPDEVKAALSAEEYAVVAPHYGLDAAPNFEDAAAEGGAGAPRSRLRGAHWHLRVTKPLADVARQLGVPPAHAQSLFDAARAKLLAQRERRVRPHRDEKILTGWNALMIKGMARAARVFDQPQWLASARSAVQFIRANLWRDGRLLATYKDGKASLNAYLDDYAVLLAALLELMQAEFSVADLEWARSLADVLLEQFEDREQGGFFFVSNDHEQLVHRAKAGHRNDTPSGNGVAALALGRLGHMVGDARYSEAARRTVQAFRPLLERQPGMHGATCCALEEQLAPPTMVVLRGRREVTAWQRELNAHYLPHVLALAIAPDAPGLPPVLDKPAGGGVNAWVCQGEKCLLPITDRATLLAVVSEREP
jgi:uncharacterized protein YyaL (SSP411 family)